MGCAFFKYLKNIFCAKTPDESRLVPETKKEYSWDKKSKVNPKDFTIENVVDAEVVREPNSVNGRQMIIQNCKGSKILVLDHCNSVTIDDCSDCQIILGPMSGSLFIRGSENLSLVAICGQFRARDCRNVTSFLCCTTQPSIEACSRFEFGCALIQYKNLKDQVKDSGLSVFNNQWSLVYDFTPVPSEGPNWQIVSSENITNWITVGSENINQFELVIGERTKSDVPLTLGYDSGNKEHSLVAIAECCNQLQVASEFISVLNQEENLFIVKTTESKIEKEEIVKVLPKFSSKGEVVNIIAIHLVGGESRRKCTQIADLVGRKFDSLEHLHISDCSAHASKLVKTFMSNG
ncbi:protein XRP2-like [Neocloeon triangulifer]|uniref:protein XRP2-like n=1 Tax=Neocloeon triangulifer TaxID=2078957 RepID=UPI00286EF22F|nr:protein XRP2-like [Neocloeon triangulifer]